VSATGVCVYVVSATCEATAAATVSASLTGVVDEVVSSKSEVARERLRSSSSVASIQSDELGKRLLCLFTQHWQADQWPVNLCSCRMMQLPSNHTSLLVHCV